MVELQTSEVARCTWLHPHALHWQHPRNLSNKQSQQHWYYILSEQHSLLCRAEKRASINIQVWPSSSRLVRSPIMSSCTPSVSMAMDDQAARGLCRGTYHSEWERVWLGCISREPRQHVHPHLQLHSVYITFNVQIWCPLRSSSKSWLTKFVEWSSAWMRGSLCKNSAEITWQRRVVMWPYTPKARCWIQTPSSGFHDNYS